jgi:Ca2+:H+ antiporter
MLAVVSLIIPTISFLLAKTPRDQIAHLSRGTAVILLVTYSMYTYFVHRTHKELYNEPPRKVEKRKQSKLAKSILVDAVLIPEEEPEEPTLTLWGTIITLVAFTALLGAHTEFATSNLTTLMRHAQLSTSFVGLVIISVFSLDLSCISAAIADKQDANIVNTLHRCTQMTLLITPLLILLAWIISADDMTLLFSNFEVAALFLTVLISNYASWDGKSHWYVNETVLYYSAYCDANITTG